MSVIRHRTIRVSGINVFVREAGEPTRPTLVLLHGFPSSSRHYVRLMDFTPALFANLSGTVTLTV